MQTHSFSSIAFAGPKADKINPNWLSVRASDDPNQPVEMLIYDQIGIDWWDGSGVAAKQFAEELKKIPADKEIVIALNSPGGSVPDGMAIYNQLQQRKAKVTVRVDGYALSIASIIALAGSELQMAENAMLMIHDPWAVVSGNSTDLRKQAETLDKHRDVMSAVYERKTGRTAAEIQSAMTAETWFTAAEAKAFGFANTILAPSTVAASFDFSAFRRVPEAAKKPASLSGEATKQEDTSMNKAQIIALLKKHGINAKEDASEQDLLALLTTALEKTNAAGQSTQAAGAVTTQTASTQSVGNTAAQSDITALSAAVKSIQDANSASRKADIRAKVEAARDETRIKNEDVDYWCKLAEQDITVLAKISAFPQAAREPVNVEVSGSDPMDAVQAIARVTAQQKRQFAANLDDRDCSRNIGKLAKNAAGIYASNRKRIMEIFAANTISSSLQLNVILNEMIYGLYEQLLPVRAFSTVFENVPLAGTDIVAVNYFPIVSTASTDWNAANGYVMGDSTQSAKSVTLNKRKYQPIRFSSSEIDRQPALSLNDIGIMKAHKLGADTFTDILSVVTNANYGTAGLVSATNAFDVVDVGTLKTVCDKAKWPTVSRSLIVSPDYDNNLIGASSTEIRSATSYGGNETIRDGKPPRILGFDYYMSNNIPGNSENLGGMVVFKSAILVATAPVAPSAEVRSQLTDYRVIVHPMTGLSFNFRAWGDPNYDETRQVIEMSYGYAVGEAGALKRITTA